MLSRPDDTFVIGHAASGKSAWAENEVLHMASAGSGRAIYVATAEALDAEMKAKVARHAARRGSGWTLVETPFDLAATCAERRAGEVVLIDCATMWLTRLVMARRDWRRPAQDWITAMTASPACYVVVTNDVGGGVVPDNAVARAFQRDQGLLNQQLAAAMARVVLVTAGLPMRLKG